eukprot:TRINITY_DN229_c0_g1_i1.p1 TRINITY_DN229_c0_g1~~TRINITY_DN229_c0_g1_i1.p1  ORF type:complete len:113 (-),score=47.18 TRINITY_DN229_c0_g1_i1:81-419(-)
MRHLAAYLLLVLGGNQSPTADDISQLLAQGGVQSDDSKVEKLIAELSGKSLEDILEAGRAKLSAVPTSGGASAGGAAKAEDVVEEEVVEEEPSESSEGEMGFSFFGSESSSY